MYSFYKQGHFLNWLGHWFFGGYKFSENLRCSLFKTSEDNEFIKWGLVPSAGILI